MPQVKTPLYVDHLGVSAPKANPEADSELEQIQMMSKYQVKGSTWWVSLGRC